MKNSGVVCKLKHYAKILNGKDYGSDISENGEYPIMGSGGEFGRTSKYLYNKPSVLLGRKGTVDKPLYIDIPFWTVDTMYYTEISKSAFPKFFYYLCTTIDFDFYQYGSAVPSMTQKDLNNVVFPFVDVETQQKIADFLDGKCSLIDGTIERERLYIEKLKEYRQSLITETLTKGLDPTAPMKDSGIEWIGDIPEGWEIVRLKFLCKICTGSKDTVNSTSDGMYPFYVRSPKVEKIDTYGFDGEAVLMAGDGVGAGRVFHYVNGKFDYHQRVYNLHFFYRIDAKFLYYYLTNSFWKEIERGNAKSTVDSIRLPMLLNFPVCTPSVSEQKVIANYLDEKTAQIDGAISKKEMLIEKLQEYKKSLIYEAVTGKVEIL